MNFLYLLAGGVLVALGVIVSRSEHNDQIEHPQGSFATTEINHEQNWLLENHTQVGFRA